MSERTAPSECANCGADIPPTACACPECGADERTGWRETSVYDGLELPDAAAPEEHFNHPETSRTHRLVNGIAWYWWCAAVALLLLLGLGALALV
jgi:hypothetical protein